VSAPGYLRPDELMTVQGNVQLANANAHAFLAMRDDAAERDHVNITIATPAGGYRSHAMDVDMHAHPQNYNINPALVGGLYPVGKSKHALGTEADIAGGLAWVIRNGARYGFTRTEIAKGDLNHFHHDGITFAGGNSQPITEGVLMAHLSDAEQTELLTKTRAIYDALFSTTPTSRGSLGVLAELKKVDDALFKTDPTSFGTPGGVLKTLRAVTDKLGITKP